MFVSSLAVTGLRSFTHLTYKPVSGINIIFGKNNAGKTTILEGIGLCSNLKSFKQININDLINRSSSSFEIRLNVVKNDEKLLISVKKSNSGKLMATLNDKRVSGRSLSVQFPLISLAFGNENVVTSPAETRRGIIDWGAFHVKQSHLEVYQAYQKVLKTRNTIIKKGDYDNLQYWTDEVVKHGNNLDLQRKEYFAILQEQFVKVVKLANSKVEKSMYEDIAASEITYSQGWPETLSLSDALTHALEKDKALKYTSVGPHRSDMLIQTNTVDIKSICSMSTQVVVSLLIMISQSNVFHVKHGFKPLLLIDDLFFGIDEKNLGLVINLLSESKSQCILTAPDLYEEKVSDINEESVVIYKLSDGQIRENKE